MNFGEFIDEAIKRKGITKKQIAEEIGVTQSSISKYTKNKVIPSDDTVLKLERILDLKNGSLQKIIDDARAEKVSMKKRKEVKNDVEEEVLRVWKRGERTPYEVSRITGYSMRVIARYLPVGGGFG